MGERSGLLNVYLLMGATVIYYLKIIMMISGYIIVKCNKNAFKIRTRDGMYVCLEYM